MIKDLNKKDKPNWSEKIQLELSLFDLQTIFDCVGAVPFNYLKEKHKNTAYEIDVNQFCNIYDDLEKIINNYNGISDIDENVNLVSLVIEE